MKGKRKKYLSLVLALAMLISVLTPYSTVFARPYYDVDTSLTEDNTETTTEVTEEGETVSDDTEDVTEGDTQGNTDVTEEPTDTTEDVTEATDTTEATTDATTEAPVTEEVEEGSAFDKMYEVKGLTVDEINEIDFSSCELLISTEDETIFTSDTNVISGYEGVYLTSYETPEITKNAFTYYYDKADFVEANITFKVSDEEDVTEDNTGDTEAETETATEAPTEANTEEKKDDTADLSEINTGDDSIAVLNEIVEDEVKEAPKNTIALIDTGVNTEDKNIIERVDLIESTDDKKNDDNGHGTKMYETIIGEDPDAQIISIKALNKDGKGQVSDIYAAIMYAIEKDVDVINLSISAYSTLENSCVKEAIIEATKKDIIVVGAAGNNSREAKYFIPANIKEAIICAGLDEEGNPLTNSNFGETVDYFVYGESSSYAAARFTGILSKIGMDKILETINTDKIFTNTYHEVSTDTDADEEEDIFDMWGDIIWIYPNENDPNFETAKEYAPTGYPNQIQVDYSITSSTGVNAFPGNSFRVPNNYGDGIYWGNNPNGVFNTGTRFNWSVRDWSIVDSGFNKVNFSFTKGMAFCTKRGAMFPAGATGDDWSLFYTSTGSTATKKRYIRCGIAATNRPESSGYQTFALEAFLSRTGTNYEFTLKKDNWAGGASSGFDNIVYQVEVLNKTGDYTVCVLDCTLDSSGYVKSVTQTDSTGNHPTISDKVITYNGAQHTVKAITVAVRDTSRMAVRIREKSVPADNKNAANNVVEEVDLESTGEVQVISDFDTDALKDYIKFTCYGDLDLYKFPTSKEPSDNINLAGAEYTIYTDAACTNKLTVNRQIATNNYFTFDGILKTNKYGHAKVTGLPTGTYYIKETKPLAGYGTDPTVHKVVISKPSAIYCNDVDPGVDISPFFDPVYYFNYSLRADERATLGVTNPNNPDDVQKLAKHYFVYGFKEGRNASARFNGLYYLYNYPDLLNWAMKRAGYSSNITAEEVSNFHPDVNDLLNVMAHYYLYGMAEGRRAVPSKEEYRKSGTTGTSASFTLNFNKTWSSGNNSISYNESIWFPKVDWDATKDVASDATLGPIVYSEEPQYWATVKKASTNPNCTTDNPNYSLNGAQYMIFKTQAAANSKDTTSSNYCGTVNIKSNGDGNEIIDVTKWIDTNSKGEPQNTYLYAIETKPGKNYMLDNTVHRFLVKPSENNKRSVPAIANVTDEPIGDPITIEVVKNGVGGKSLEGAEFTVNFYAEDITKNYTFDKLKNDFTPVAAYTKTVTTDANGKAEIHCDPSLAIDGGHYPLGYITVEETNAPDGFNLDGSSAYIIDNKGTDDASDDETTEIPVKMAFVLASTGSSSTGYERDWAYVINDDGTRGAHIVGTTSAAVANIGVEEIELRADFFLEKKGKKGEPLPARIFEIENLETHEKHTFETDEEGKYSSQASYKSHADEGGMWFAKGAQDTERTSPDDTMGALPAGNYRVTEIDAKGHQKEEPIDFTVSTDGALYEIYDDGRADGAKVICDMEMPTLGTLALVELFAEGESATDAEYEEAIKNCKDENYKFREGFQKELPATKGQKITDICEYTDLRYDTDYTLYGRLMQIDKDGNEKPFTSNGKEVTGITHFHTADTYTYSKYDACGVETVKFEDLDFTDIQGTSFVVYEYLYIGDLTEDDIKNENYDKEYVGANNNEVKFPLIHADKNDKYQTVKTPDGITHATAEDGTQTVTSIKGQKIKILDEVTYTGLKVGETYTAEGKLYLIKDDELFGKKYSDFTEDELKKLEYKDAKGTVVTSSKEFTATSKDGSVVVEFEFDAADITESVTEVVFEDVKEKKNGVTYFTHAVVTDEQTVRQPVIWTTAMGTEGRNELIYNAGKFVDRIHYENLDPNSKYLVRGFAYDKKTGKLLELNGKQISAEHEFTTGASNRKNGAVDGTYDLEFEITEDQYLDIEGKDMVIFEYLINAKGTMLATHEDLTDKLQELTVPKIRTRFTDKKTETHIAYPDEQTTLIDVVNYDNLIPGKSYRMTSTLMNKKTNTELLDENGKKITAEKEFTASETGSGSVEMVFTFNAKILKLQGTTLVCYEWCIPKEGTIPVGCHTDINDKDQSVEIPKASTKVSRNEFKAPETIKFTDTISFENFLPNHKYVAKGWLVDSKGNKLTVDGKEITAEKEFTPTTANGTIDVPFPEFSSKTLSGKYVVYEEIYYVKEVTDEKTNKTSSTLHLIAEHKDLTDTKQTLSVKPDTPKTGDTFPVIPIVIGFIFSILGIGAIVFMKKRSSKATK